MSADKRPRLISPSFLLVLALLAGAIFAALQLSNKSIRWDFEESAADAMSLAYLQAVLQAEPDSLELRQQLVEHFLAVGEWQKARQVLAQGGPEFTEQPATQWLTLKVLLAEAAARQPEPTVNERLQRQIEAQIDAADPQSLSLEQLLFFAENRLQAENPAAAADWYLLAAERAPQQAAHWYSEAGRWQLAAGHPAEAANSCRNAYRAAADPETKIRLALAATDAYRAAGQDAQALNWLAIVLGEQPNNPDLLARGVVLAAAADPARAAKWNQRYLQLRPQDVTALDRQVALEIARQEKLLALEFSRRLLRLKPTSATFLRRHAELAEWNQAYPEALDSWLRLIKQGGEPGIYAHMQQLARNFYQVDQELALLGLLAERGNLAEKELLAAAERYEYLGYPERAISLLQKQLRPTRSPAVLRLLAQLRERDGDLQGALDSWQQLLARADADDNDRLQAARLLWQQGRTESAWRLLQGSALANSDDLFALQLAGELAWRQSDFTMAAVAYQRLARLQPANQFARQRLLIAYQQLGKERELLALLEQAWQQDRDPEILLSALQVAEQAKLWPELGRLLQLASESEALDGRSGYWRLRGDEHTRRGEFASAYQAYSREYGLAPNPVAAENMLWSLINQSDLAALARELDRQIAAELPPSDARALAQQQLGRYWEALDWYQQGLDQHLHDPLWLLNYAELLKRVDWLNSAQRVRRFALRSLLTDPAVALDSEQLEQLAALLGVPAAAKQLERQGASNRQQQLLNWFFAREEIVAARRQLERQNLPATDLPAWMQLQLALAEGDAEAVEKLLVSQQVTDSGDRMLAWLQLSRPDLSLAELDKVEQPELRHRRLAAAAANQLPDYAETSTQVWALGDSGGVDQQASFWFSRERYSFGLELGSSLFNNYASGRLREKPAQEWRGRLSWRYRGTGVLEADVGVRDGNGGTVWPLSVSYEAPVGQRFAYRLQGDYATPTEVSGLMRVLGMEDRLLVAGSFQFDPRLSLALQADTHRYRSLAGDDLATGVAAELTLSLALWNAPTYKWLVRGSLSMEENKLEDSLPADLQARLRPGAGLSDLVSEEFRSLGISTYLARGELRSTFPQVASPRWFVDAWLGYLQPDDNLGVNLSAGIETAVGGSDELGLIGNYGDQFSAGDNGWQMYLYYRYFFGR